MSADILDQIAQGRTDRVFELLALPDWRALLSQGSVKPLQWFVYCNDLTAIKAVLAAGGDLSSLSLDEELGHAAFFGHWRVADFLIAKGANARRAKPARAKRRFTARSQRPGGDHIRSWGGVGLWD